MGKGIYFKLDLPEFDLSDIDPLYNKIIALNDLMDMAVDSPIISKLFTQGRHSKTSFILLLQNAFQKGKYNISLSRNAQYMVLYRFPVDRRQIGIVADKIFDKYKPSYMKTYSNITFQPYSYAVVDNKANPPARRQIIAYVFRNCVSYNISGIENVFPYPNKVQATKAIDLDEDNSRT